MDSHKSLPVTCFRAALALVALLLVSGILSLTPIARASSAGGRTMLTGYLVPALQHLAPLPARAADTQRTLHLALTLKSHNQAGLTQLIQDQKNPRSLRYHHYLTPQQFAAQFSPSQAEVQTVEAYLRSQGLRVTSVDTSRLQIDFNGKQAAVERAFGVQIANYSFQGRTVFAPSTEPSIPSALAGLISNITGLNNVAQPHRQMITQALNGPNGGLDPTQLRGAYDITPLINQQADGRAQTIAILEAANAGFMRSDITTYRNQFGLGTGQIAFVSVDGSSNTINSYSSETELDIEVASAIAPQATLMVYVSPDLIDFISSTAWQDAFNQIVDDNFAQTVSFSWSVCEQLLSNSQLSAFDAIFQRGAAQGISFFAASGDNGTDACQTPAPFFSPSVNFPADEPQVVGVGGTTSLSLSAANVWQSEMAWSGSGGGYSVSSPFSRPSYQVAPGVDTNVNQRQVPDVSALATNYAFFCTVQAKFCTGGWSQIGGTSASTPLWAAMVVDINSYLFTQHMAPLGHVDAELYTFASSSQPFPAYHDITTGGNSGSSVSYLAGPGYDRVTGLGTPDAWNMAQDAVRARVPSGINDVYTFAGNQVSRFTGKKDLGTGNFQTVDDGNIGLTNGSGTSSQFGSLSAVIARGGDVYELRAGHFLFELLLVGTKSTACSTKTGYCLIELDNNPATAEVEAGGNGFLYQRHATAQGDFTIWQSTGACFHCWTQIDNNSLTHQLVANGSQLYQVRSDGTVWQASNVPLPRTGALSWTQIDWSPNPSLGRDVQLALTNSGVLFATKVSYNASGTVTGTQIIQYLGTPFSWADASNAQGGTVLYILASSHLYEVTTSQAIWHYNGRGTGDWDRVGLFDTQTFKNVQPGIFTDAFYRVDTDNSIEMYGPASSNTLMTIKPASSQSVFLSSPGVAG